MQYQPGTWYLPWGMPLQKMLAMQFSQTGTPTLGSPFSCQVLPPQQQNSPAPAGTTMQVSPSHNYQHPVGSYPCTSGGITLHQISSGPPQAANVSLSSGLLNGHTTHALAHHCLQNSHQLPTTHAQQRNALMPATGVNTAAAAAAMYTPLPLHTYLASTAPGTVTNPLTGITENNRPRHGLSSNCGTHMISPQTNQANIATSQLNVLSSSVSPHTTVMPSTVNLSVDVLAMRHHLNNLNAASSVSMPPKKLLPPAPNKDAVKVQNVEKRKAEDAEQLKDLKKAKLETKALKAKRPGFTDERYHETSYYIENGLRKVYPYYFTFTTFTKGRWVGEKILDVFAREFRAHPAEEYERCIKSGTLTVNYDKVPIDYRLKHNDLLANIVHRHEVPVTSQPITIVHMDDDIVVVNKPASIPVHPCGRYRHNTVVFILAKEYNLKNLRTIHRLDRLTSGLLLFGRSPKKARQMEHQIRNRQVQKEYICRVEGHFPEGIIECTEPIEVVSYKIGVCKVSSKGKDCTTTFQKISQDGHSSVVLCKPLTGRMHQIRVHLQYLGYPVVNDPLYNHEVFGPLKGRGGDVGGKNDDELVRDLINIHNAENWLGIDGDSDISMFKTIKGVCDADTLNFANAPKVGSISDNDSETSRETSPACANSTTAIAETTSNDNIKREQQRFDICDNVTNINCISTPMTNVVKEHNNVEGDDAHSHIKVTVATQTGHESPDMAYNAEKMTNDKHCYECKVRYRDPKPKDLVMYLHAWKYKGPGWEYETELPNWAKSEWMVINHN